MAARSVLGEAVLRIVADVRGLRAGLKTGLKELENFSGQVKKLSDSLNSVAVEAGKVSLALGALFAPAIKTAMEFQQTMSTVQAVTLDSMRDIARAGGPAVQEQFQALIDKARELGAETTFSARQVADAMKFMGQAGLSADQVLRGVADTLLIARAGMLDLGQAADIATDVMSAFGLAAEDIGRIGDNLAQAARISNTNVEQMGEAFKFAAPLAGAFGQNIEDISAAFALLAQQGLRGSIAGTGVARILSSLAKGGEKFDEVLNKYGLTIQEVSPYTNSFTTIIQRLAAAGLTAGDAMDLFGERAGRTAVALLNQAKNLGSFTNQMDSSKGAAAEMAEVMADNMAGALVSVKSRLEALQITFVNMFGGAIQQGLERLANFLATVDTWMQMNPELVMQIGKVAAMIGTVSTALTVLLPIVSFFIGLITKLGGIATAAIGFLTGPWGIALVAIIGVVIAAWEQLKEVVEATYEAFKGVFEILRDAFDGVYEVLKEALSSIVDIIRASVEALVGVIRGLTPVIKELDPLIEIMAKGAMVLIKASTFGLKVLAATAKVGGKVINFVGTKIHDLYAELTGGKTVAEKAAEAAIKLAAAQKELGDAIQSEFKAMQNSNLEIQTYASIRQRIIAIQEKGADATIKERQEYIRLQKQLDSMGKTDEEALKQQQESIKKTEDRLEQIRELGERTPELINYEKELERQLARQNKVLQDMNTTMERRKALEEVGIEATLASVDAAQRYIDTELQRQQLIEDGGAAREKLAATEKDLAKVLDDISKENLSRFQAELQALDERAEKERELVDKRIEYAQKSIAADNALIENQMRGHAARVKALKEEQANALPFRQKQIEVELSEAQAELDRKRVELQDRIKTNEQLIIDTRKAGLTIDEAIAKRRKDLFDAEREARNDFMRDIQIEEAKRVGATEAAANLEYQKKIDLLKKELDEKFDLTKAATEEERQWMQAQRRMVEAERMQQFEDQFKQQVGADEPQLNDIREREIDLEKSATAQLLRKAQTLGDILMLYKAIAFIREAQEQRAVAAARKAMNIEQRLAAMQGRPGNGGQIRQDAIAKLEQEAAMQRQIAQKRRAEAGLGPFESLDGQLVGQKIDQVQQALIEGRARIAGEFQNWNLMFRDAASVMVDSIIQVWVARLPELVAIVADAMAAIKVEMDPNTRHSPSLIDVWNSNVATVQDGLAQMQGSMMAENFGMPQLKAAHASQVSAGAFSPPQQKAKNDNRKVTMNVTNHLDAKEFQRHVGRALSNAAMTDGAV